MIVLGIDQAARSGWGIAPGRSVTRSGVATTHAERKAVVELARELAGGDMRQVLVMLEDHSAMPLGRLTHADRNTPRKGRQAAPQRNTATILGMGAARGWWEALLDDAGHPKSLRDSVEPRVWRAKMGIRGADTDALKLAACRWASTHMLREVTDIDEGDAVCITAFAAIDGIQRNEARKAKARTEARDKRGVRKQLELGERPKLITDLPANDNGRA
jgi:hypothetical protein